MNTRSHKPIIAVLATIAMALLIVPQAHADKKKKKEPAPPTKKTEQYPDDRSSPDRHEQAGVAAAAGRATHQVRQRSVWRGTAESPGRTKGAKEETELDGQSGRTADNG